MIRLLLAASVAMIAAPAFATDVRTAARAADWTGWYAGAQYDYLDGNAAIGGDFDGDVFGVFYGYRFDFGDVVVGGELDYSIGDLTRAGITTDIDGLLRIGVEVGYDLGAALIYATVGYTHMDLSIGGASAHDHGIYYGVGADYMISDTVSLGIEILRHDFNDFTGFPGNDIDITTVGLNLAYRF